MVEANRHRQKLRLAQVKQALDAMARDEYGECRRCDEFIGIARLSAAGIADLPGLSEFAGGSTLIGDSRDDQEAGPDAPAAWPRWPGGCPSATPIGSRLGNGWTPVVMTPEPESVFRNCRRWTTV